MQKTSADMGATEPTVASCGAAGNAKVDGGMWSMELFMAISMRKC